jgi:chloramphenicol 3-O phosphotransferase
MTSASTDFISHGRGGKTTVKPGNVIVLNGTSSSGKTTLAKVLQRILDEPYLHLGNDQFLHPNAPEKLVVYAGNGTVSTPVAGWLAVFQEDRLVDLQVGSVGLRWLRGMYHAMAAWSEVGNHLIADVVIHEESILQAAVEALYALPAWLISVYCPLEVAEQREQARAERRAPGGARVFFEGVYRQDVYDLRVDTTLSSPEECAGRIREYVQSGQPPTAFRQLHRCYGDLP